MFRAKLRERNPTCHETNLSPTTSAHHLANDRCQVEEFLWEGGWKKVFLRSLALLAKLAARSARPELVEGPR